MHPLDPSIPPPIPLGDIGHNRQRAAYPFSHQALRGHAVGLYHVGDDGLGSSSRHGPRGKRPFAVVVVHADDDLPGDVLEDTQLLLDGLLEVAGQSLTLGEPIGWEGREDSVLGRGGDAHGEADGRAPHQNPTGRDHLAGELVVRFVFSKCIDNPRPQQIRSPVRQQLRVDPHQVRLFLSPGTSVLFRSKEPVNQLRTFRL